MQPSRFEVVTRNKAAAAGYWKQDIWLAAFVMTCLPCKNTRNRAASIAAGWRNKTCCICFMLPVEKQHLIQCVNLMKATAYTNLDMRPGSTWKVASSEIVISFPKISRQISEPTSHHVINRFHYPSTYSMISKWSWRFQARRPDCCNTISMSMRNNQDPEILPKYPRDMLPHDQANCLSAQQNTGSWLLVQPPHLRDARYQAWESREASPPPKNCPGSRQTWRRKVTEASSVEWESNAGRSREASSSAGKCPQGWQRKWRKTCQ